MVIVIVQRVSCVHMKILCESFSFLSTPFVRLNSRPKLHRYVIAIAVFYLLFSQCISHDSNTDKQNDNVVATHKKWLNDSNVLVASDARVVISKRQSPTKISNSSSHRMATRSYASTDIPSFLSSSLSSTTHHEKSLSFAFSQTTFAPFNRSASHRKQQTTADSTNNALILIQTKKNNQLNHVRDQFQQFTDMFGVKLANITIDFDAIDGK